MNDLHIVWREGALIAVSKPAGLASQGGDGLAGQNLVDLARAHFGSKQVAVLHRLDRNVSGLVLLALDAVAARVMSAQLQDHAIDRQYIAVVRGLPNEDNFEIDAWLSKDSASNQVRAIDAAALDKLSPRDRDGFKEARTRCRVLERFSSVLGRCAVLQVQLVTGRSHQIRAHLQHIGLPIVGDPKYGVAALGVRRPLLHAARLAFTAPSGERIELHDPPPWNAHELRALRKAPNADRLRASAPARKHRKR